jgi:hypothetical protein
MDAPVSGDGGSGIDHQDGLRAGRFEQETGARKLVSQGMAVHF